MRQSSPKRSSGGAGSPPLWSSTALGPFVTNSLLFTALGMHIESRFTTRRTIFFILLSGVGGNFFDASFGVRLALTA